jgi:ATP-binding cassette subfamily C protein
MQANRSAAPAHSAARAAASRTIGRGVGLAALLSLGCNLGALAVPLFNMEMFNRVLTTRNVATLWAMCAGLGITLLTYAAIDQLRGTALAVLANRLSRQTLPSVLDAIAAAPASVGRETPHGEPLHDLERLRTFLSSATCVAPFDLAWTPVLLGVLLTMHWGYAATAALSCAILLGLNLLGDAATRRHLLRASHAAATELQDVAGAFRGAEAVLAMDMLPALSRRWDAAHRTTRQDTNRAMLQSRAIAALTRTLRMSMTGVMVALGLVLVLNDLASSGSMVAGNMILARLLLPFEQISNTYRQWVEALAAWRRLQALLDAPPPAERYRSPLPRPRGELLVDRLVHMPAGSDRAVLRGVSFSLGAGQILGIIGPSGAGKTTLVKLLLGMHPPTAGGVFLDGHPTFLWEREDFARHVGYVPQSLALLDGTVADNIARMQEPDFARVRAAALRAGVHGAIAALPHGYSTHIAGMTLSAGQRQRIAVARALYDDPRLLILDEPSAFLDHEGETALCELVAALQAGGTGVILVSHRPALIRTADKLMVLKDGLVDRFGARDVVLSALHGPPVQLVRADKVREVVS